MTALDPAVSDLLAAIDQTLAGMSDWRCVTIRSAIADAQTGDPQRGADWLRTFLAHWNEATP